MNSEGPFIRAEGLTIRYPLARAGIATPGGARKHTALNSLSFSLTAGERLGLLGRNGAGKSTLLRALAGVYPPTHGKLEVRGSVAAVFNISLGFVPEATGYENIFLRGAMLGLPFDELREMVPDIVAFSGLGDWMHEPIQRYSSGMALRLAFAITTSVESEILLLDEWLGAGDADFIARAKARMSERVERSRILVLATHNVRLMREQCDTGLVLSGGEEQFHGPIEEAIEHYASLSTPAHA